MNIQINISKKTVTYDANNGVNATELIIILSTLELVFKRRNVNNFNTYKVLIKDSLTNFNNPTVLSIESERIDVILRRKYLMPFHINTLLEIQNNNLINIQYNIE